jgi:hypothetical protein
LAPDQLRCPDMAHESLDVGHSGDAAG